MVHNIKRKLQAVPRLSFLPGVTEAGVSHSISPLQDQGLSTLPFPVELVVSLYPPEAASASFGASCLPPCQESLAIVLTRATKGQSLGRYVKSQKRHCDLLNDSSPKPSWKEH